MGRSLEGVAAQENMEIARAKKGQISTSFVRKMQSSSLFVGLIF